jgi:DNA-directed RNA polymerase specialized sigma54-like protein
MSIGPRLEFRQSQSLVMTPQLRQAIKLLQFSNLEVAAYVEEELERNPLLEHDERPEVPAERASPDLLPASHAETADAVELVSADTRWTRILMAPMPAFRPTTPRRSPAPAARKISRPTSAASTSWCRPSPICATISASSSAWLSPTAATG